MPICDSGIREKISYPNYSDNCQNYTVMYVKIDQNCTTEIWISWKWKWLSLSCVWLLVTPWTVACQSLEFSIYGILQERTLEWVAVPSPRDLPGPGIEPRSPALQADSLPSEPLQIKLGRKRNSFLVIPIYGKWKWNHTMVSDSLWPGGL